ncbi:hypothetical protein [Leifsonia sp. WHRI 6310E]|uniref:hypothetical protein n=1 Tax=Leifsonia sp. WHRI 6310E TaxID=3162562 RepID=UPI0032EB98F9
MDADARARATQRLELLRVMRAGRDRVDEVLAIIRDSDSDDGAAAAIGELLGCDAGTAFAVLSLQLRRFRVRPTDLLTAEIDELEAALSAPASAPAAAPVPAPSAPFRPRDEYTSREHRYSLGTVEATGEPYASVPVTTGVADYEEFYRLTPEQHARFLADPDAALAFVEECRLREHDDLLLQQPGWNRGTPS